jgi:hypothetical protein
VRVIRRWTPDGLTGVVDDEIEPISRRQQVVAERLDARRVPEIQAEQLEPVAPDLEVGLARIADGGIRGKRVVTTTRAPDLNSLSEA